jgi:hypothetical protein
MAASLAQLGLMLGLLAVAKVVAGTRPTVRHRSGPGRQLTARRPLQVVAADLRRLTRQLDRVQPGRRGAVLRAYDAILVEVADLLEVPHDLGADGPRGPAREAERARLLAALEDAGLAVRV